MWLERAYEWFYTRVGGEPWTTIIRRWQKNYPLMFLLIFLMAGVLVGRFCRRYWWQLLVAFVLGIFVGHLWF